MNEYNNADIFNRMFRDSKNNGYNTSYTKVKNDSYGGKQQNNSKVSNAKAITYIFVGGIILFYTYKNVLKPAAKVINNVLNLFDTEEEKPNARSYAKHDDRVLNGQVTRLTPREANKLKRSSLIAHESLINPGQYTVEDYF